MNQPNFAVGDQIRVYTKDQGESKVHLNQFEGIVISLRGQKNNQTFIVRRHGTDGVFIEKIFPVDTPSIEKIDVLKKGQVRRAKLYYLRKTKAK